MNTPPTSAPEQQPSLEHLLLRFGLVTLDQLSAALREQTELGTTFTEVLVRDGLVSAEDLARIADRAPASAAPTPVPEPEPLPPAAVVASVPNPVDPEPAPLYVPEPVAFEPAREPEPLYVPEPAPVYESDRHEVEPEHPNVPPVSAPEPPPVSAPEPQPAPVVTGYVVRGRLVNGEEIEIASVEVADEAQRIARDAMRACSQPDGADWPVLNGRYVRPQSIVSIEVAERG